MLKPSVFSAVTYHESTLTLTLSIQEFGYKRIHLRSGSGRYSETEKELTHEEAVLCEQRKAIPLFLVNKHSSYILNDLGPVSLYVFNDARVPLLVCPAQLEGLHLRSVMCFASLSFQAIKKKKREALDLNTGDERDMLLRDEVADILCHVCL